MGAGRPSRTSKRWGLYYQTKEEEVNQRMAASSTGVAHWQHEKTMVEENKRVALLTCERTRHDLLGKEPGGLGMYKEGTKSALKRGRVLDRLSKSMIRGAVSLTSTTAGGGLKLNDSAQRMGRPGR